MWTNTPDALAARTMFIAAAPGSEMVFRASDWIDAIDYSCDSGYWPGEDESMCETKEQTMARKVREASPEMIMSLLLYGNVYPIEADYNDGRIMQGNGNHRLAVLAHYGMTVLVRKASDNIANLSDLTRSMMPFELAPEFDGILPDYVGS